MTPEILDLIMKAASAEGIRAAAHRQGMTTLRECAIRKALAGETSLEEVYRVTSEDHGFDEEGGHQAVVSAGMGHGHGVKGPVPHPQDEAQGRREKRVA